MAEKRQPKHKRKTIPDDVREVMKDAEKQRGARESEQNNPLEAFAMPGNPAPAMATDPGTPEDDIVEWCASLDQSDTDNAARLIAHFGRDVLVVSQAKARAPFWAVWTGRYWDTDTGAARAFAVAQKVGPRMLLELERITLTESQQKLVDAANSALEKGKDRSLSDADRKLVKKADSVLKRLGDRIDSRRKFAVTSKNRGRIEAMLACAAPHIQRDPDAFNADKLKFACNGHTISFRRFKKDKVINAGDPDNEREIEVDDAELIVCKGHERSDLITQIVPVDFKPDADCPLWRAFLAEMIPDLAVRKMIQVASGLGLLGLTVQKLFFHFGAGANGKSVYMETLTRLLGESAVTLPASSFMGESRSAGSASPDIAKLYGRRFLRVKEIPEGEELQEAFVKEATGGEAISARDLFLGYFDFEPIFTAHMSGNGYPRITGTDEGIWRRMAVVHWPVQIPIEMRRPFEEMIARFEPEYPGILNWMIEGVMTYLREGLFIPESVTASTAQMRFEMDPTAEFCRDCVDPDPVGAVRGAELYQAYVRHHEDRVGRHGRPISIQRFGRIIKKKYEFAEDRGTVYRVRLHDVPVSEPGGFPPGYGGLGT